MILLASPWFWGGVASLASGAIGWTTGFFASDSIKYLVWFVALCAAAIAFYYVMQVVK